MSTLRFHQLLYTRQAIDATVEAFEGHARVTVTEQDAYHQVEVEPVDPEAAEAVVGEFTNYVLALSIEEKRSR